MKFSKVSKLSYYHADVSRKSKSVRIGHFFIVAVTFDLNKIIQFCFDILKDNLDYKIQDFL